jgi:hypothetical protein
MLGAHETHDPVTGRYIGPETLSITLKKKVGDKTTITVQEPTAEQLSMSLDVERTKNELEGNILLITLCTGLLPPEARRLGKRDFEEARDFALGFFDKPPAPPVVDAPSV